MITDHDRSGWIGASDVQYVIGNWKTKTWEKWWMTKLGLSKKNIETEATKAGTNWEHKILDSLGIPYGLKQWMAVLIGGPAGIAALIGATMLLHRRLVDPRIRVTSTFPDILIMVVIWLQLVIGLLTITQTLQHMDGAEMVRFMTWSQSVVTWNINAWVTVVDVHWLYKLHIFLGLIITMLFPFTRLVHIWSGLAAPFRYLLTRPGYQIVRSRRTRPLEERRRAYDARQGKSGPKIQTPAE